jgi:K+-sensing histidine kinase KdpD
MLFSQTIVYLLFLLKQQKLFFWNKEQSITILNLLNKQLARTRGIEPLLKVAILNISQAFDSEVLILLPTLENNIQKLVAYTKDYVKISLNTKEQSVA